jgi:hypothetical protein
LSAPRIGKKQIPKSTAECHIADNVFLPPSYIFFKISRLKMKIVNPIIKPNATNQIHIPSNDDSTFEDNAPINTEHIVIHVINSIQILAITFFTANKTTPIHRPSKAALNSNLKYGATSTDNCTPFINIFSKTEATIPNMPVITDEMI